MSLKLINYIWSPSSINRLIKYSPKTIDLYDVILKDSDIINFLRKMETFQENDIKCIGWNSGDFIALALGSGVIKILSLSNSNISEINELGLIDREIKTKHAKFSLFLIWNPFNRNQLAQIIDKSKIPNMYECSIIIWEFQKNCRPPYNLNGQVNYFGSDLNAQMPSNINGSIHMSSTFYSTESIHQQNLSSQPHFYEYCKGEIVNSFVWIADRKFICGVNNKHLKLFNLQSTNPLRTVSTDAVYGLCYVHKYIASFIDDKIVLWDEERLDKPLLTNAEEHSIESIEWSPGSDNYLLIVYRDKSFVKILDTLIAIKNSNPVNQALVDQVITINQECTVTSATWHRNKTNCILILTSLDNVEMHNLRKRVVLTISSNHHIAWFNGKQLRYTITKQHKAVDDSYNNNIHIGSRGVMDYRVLDQQNNETSSSNRPNKFHCSSLMSSMGDVDIDDAAMTSTNDYRAVAVETGATASVSNFNLGNQDYRGNTMTTSNNKSTTANNHIINYNFMISDISVVMKHRAVKYRYGLEPVSRDNLYSIYFEEDSQLRLFWKWIEDPARNNLSNTDTSKTKVSPYVGVIDCIRDVTTITKQHKNCRLELVFKMKEQSSVFSKPQSIYWNNIGEKLPFDKYNNQYRDKLFNACGLPFHKKLDDWRHILERMDNKERSAALALVTLNFDVALQYLKMIPNDKAIDNDMLRLCLAGYSTQPEMNTHWPMICRDVLNRLGDSRPYLSLIFNFLIANVSNDLDFLKKLNIQLIDKIAIAALYFDDERLMNFLNYLCIENLSQGNLESVILTGLRSTELIDLLQCFIDQTSDVQTASIAILQAFSLTKNHQLKTSTTLGWIERYRYMLDIWRLWFIRADFDIANQYFSFVSDFGSSTTGGLANIVTTPSATTPTSGAMLPGQRGSVFPQSRYGTTNVTLNSQMTNVNTTANTETINTPKSNNKSIINTDQTQVYVSCHYCGWNISQPSKFTARSHRRNVQLPNTSSVTPGNKPRPSVESGGGGGSSAIRPNLTSSSAAMHSGGCKSTICQNCRQPLPRCSVCLMHMSVSGEQVMRHNTTIIGSYHQQTQRQGLWGDDLGQLRNPMNNWFVWCQQCKHGGHAQHITSWFLKWSECPVSGCKCQCYSLDNKNIVLNIE